MNGVHDLGGMDGFGPVDRTDDGHFPEPWERKVFALTLAAGMLGKWNLDQSRFAREQMEPGHYLASSYYEHWLHGLETLLVQQGLVSRGEIETGVAEPSQPLKPVAAEQVASILERGGPTLMSANAAPKYSIGDVVRTRNLHPRGHIRLPRYIRGRQGTIERCHGAHVFPDVHAGSGVKQAEILYTVAFDSQELWGKERGGSEDTVRVDVFEPYIDQLL